MRYYKYGMSRDEHDAQQVLLNAFEQRLRRRRFFLVPVAVLLFLAIIVLELAAIWAESDKFGWSGAVFILPLVVTVAWCIDWEDA